MLVRMRSTRRTNTKRDLSDDDSQIARAITGSNGDGRPTKRVRRDAAGVDKEKVQQNGNGSASNAARNKNPKLNALEEKSNSSYRSAANNEPLKIEGPIIRRIVIRVALEALVLCHATARAFANIARNIIQDRYVSPLSSSRFSVCVRIPRSILTISHVPVLQPARGGGFTTSKQRNPNEIFLKGISALQLSLGQRRVDAYNAAKASSITDGKDTNSRQSAAVFKPITNIAFVFSNAYAPYITAAETVDWCLLMAEVYEIAAHDGLNTLTVCWGDRPESGKQSLNGLLMRMTNEFLERGAFPHLRRICMPPDFFSVLTPLAAVKLSKSLEVLDMMQCDTTTGIVKRLRRRVVAANPSINNAPVQPSAKEENAATPSEPSPERRQLRNTSQRQKRAATVSKKKNQTSGHATSSIAAAGEFATEYVVFDRVHTLRVRTARYNGETSSAVEICGASFAGSDVALFKVLPNVRSIDVTAVKYDHAYANDSEIAHNDFNWHLRRGLLLARAKRSGKKGANKDADADAKAKKCEIKWYQGEDALKNGTKLHRTPTVIVPDIWRLDFSSSPRSHESGELPLELLKQCRTVFGYDQPHYACGQQYLSCLSGSKNGVRLTESLHAMHCQPKIDELSEQKVDGNTEDAENAEAEVECAAAEPLPARVATRRSLRARLPANSEVAIDANGSSKAPKLKNTNVESMTVLTDVKAKRGAAARNKKLADITPMAAVDAASSTNTITADEKLSVVKQTLNSFEHRRHLRPKICCRLSVDNTDSMEERRYYHHMQRGKRIGPYTRVTYWLNRFHQFVRCGDSDVAAHAGASAVMDTADPSATKHISRRSTRLSKQQLKQGTPSTPIEAKKVGKKQPVSQPLSVKSRRKSAKTTLSINPNNSASTSASAVAVSPTACRLTISALHIRFATFSVDDRDPLRRSYEFLRQRIILPVFCALAGVAEPPSSAKAAVKTPASAVLALKFGEQQSDAVDAAVKANASSRDKKLNDAGKSLLKPRALRRGKLSMPLASPLLHVTRITLEIQLQSNVGRDGAADRDGGDDDDDEDDYVIDDDESDPGEFLLGVMAAMLHGGGLNGNLNAPAAGVADVEMVDADDSDSDNDQKVRVANASKPVLPNSANGSASVAVANKTNGIAENKVMAGDFDRVFTPEFLLQLEPILRLIVERFPRLRLFRALQHAAGEGEPAAVFSFDSLVLKQRAIVPNGLQDG